MAAIEASEWPGNVRELESRIKRATIMADGSLITRAILELAPATENTDTAMLLNLRQVREKVEEAAIRQALAIANNNISQAANLLGITRPTLYNLIEKFGPR